MILETEKLIVAQKHVEHLTQLVLGMLVIATFWTVDFGTNERAGGDIVMLYVCCLVRGAAPRCYRDKACEAGPISALGQLVDIAQHLSASQT